MLLRHRLEALPLAVRALAMPSCGPLLLGAWWPVVLLTTTGVVLEHAGPVHAQHAPEQVEAPSQPVAFRQDLSVQQAQQVKQCAILAGTCN